MDKIVVSKANHVFLNIQTDPGIEMELSDHFCFYVPGYKFMPAYKNKMWDGKIRLYDVRKKQLYTGLFKYLREFAASRDYDIEIVDNHHYGRIDAVENIDVPALLSELHLTACGNKIEARGDQQAAVHHALSNRQSLLLSPTASGKSLIIYMAIRYYLSTYTVNLFQLHSDNLLKILHLQE